MRQAVIVDAVRSPIGRRNGVLANMHPVDLSSEVLRGLVEKTGIDPDELDDVLWGCVTQIGDQSSNIARFAVLAAGWSDRIPGVTVNRACGSSQQALEFAVGGVMSGQYDLVIAGGVETMSRVPLGAARAMGVPYGPRVLNRYEGFSFNQGLSAELVAERWKLSRSTLDLYSADSHAKAVGAIDAGAFADQIVPINVNRESVVLDEGVRRGTTVATLGGLKPAFREDGVIHAGNSSQISDGAAAILVASDERAQSLGLRPIARYHSGAVIGADPVLMLTAPIPATEKVLKRSGLALREIGVFEINEAFAPVPLAWLKEIGANPDLLNPLGGAIALGHPLGATGAVLTTKMVHYMRVNAIRYGLQAMCEGGGTANATIVELVR